MTVWAVVVAAGSGSRFGGAKQFADLAGRPVAGWAVDAARRACDGVVLVLPPACRESVDGADRVATGGATRAASVRAGLGQLPDGVTTVVVHDAARPLASADLFRRVLDAVAEGADAAIPGVPVSDTVKRVEAGTVVETLDRDSLVAVQTPQAFRLEALRRAHAAGGDATDDAALVEATGGRVVVVPGEPANIKLTDGTDLTIARALLEAR